MGPIGKPPSLQVWKLDGMWCREGLCTRRCVSVGPVAVVRHVKYLHVADGRRPEDLNVGGVGVGEGLAVPQPHHGHVGGMGLDLAGDVDGVPLPGVRRDLAVDLWRIWWKDSKRRRCSISKMEADLQVFRKCQGEGKGGRINLAAAPH